MSAPPNALRVSSPTLHPLAVSPSRFERTRRVTLDLGESALLWAVAPPAARVDNPIASWAVRRVEVLASALTQDPDDPRCGVFAGYHAYSLALGQRPEARELADLFESGLTDFENMDQDAISAVLAHMGAPSIPVVADLEGTFLAARRGELEAFFPELSIAATALRAHVSPQTFVVREVDTGHWFAMRVSSSPRHGMRHLDVVLAESIPEFRAQAEASARTLVEILMRMPAEAMRADEANIVSPPALRRGAVVFGGRVLRRAEDQGLVRERHPRAFGFEPVPARVMDIARRVEDIENVMRAPRIANVADSIRALRATRGPDRLGRDALEEILRSIHDAEAPSAGTSDLRCPSEGATSRALIEAERAPTMRAADRFGSLSARALCALFDERRDGDHSGPLVEGEDGLQISETETASLAEICARVWHRIRHDPTSEPGDPQRTRTLLERSFILALAECIEQDGHRVCPTGVAQRLCTVLQGYFDDVRVDPTQGSGADLAPRGGPHEVFTALALEWRRELERGDDDARGASPRSSSVHARFRSAAEACGERLFAESPRELETFRGLVESFLRFA